MEKTYYPKKSDLQSDWYVVDANGQTLGRVATTIAKLLLGKHKPTFTPGVPGGDYVVVINCEKIVVTGKKMDEKIYIRHSGYPGGQRSRTAREVLDKFPERLIEHAVKGMLPKNRLGSDLFRNLYVYVGPEHKQEAQQPKKIEINTNK